MARRHDINANLLFKWKRLAEAGQLGGSLVAAETPEFVPIVWEVVRFRGLEAITGAPARRRWSAETKSQIVAESLAPGW